MGQSKAEEAKITERRHRACQLRLAGLSYQEIADKLGLGSKQLAFLDIQAALNSANEDMRESAAQLREVEAARLDVLQAKAWQVMNARHVAVSGGKIVREELSVRPGPDGEPVYELGEPLEDHGPTLNAIRTLVRISERRSRLLGLDAPVAVELDGQLRVIVEGIPIEAITGQPAEPGPDATG